MTDRLADQIRIYAEAMYAAATPVDELAPKEAGSEPTSTAGPVQVIVEPSSRNRPGRRLVGPVVGLAAAVVVLLAALPLLLLRSGPDLTDTRSTSSDSVTAAPSSDVFDGEWVGRDPTDGSTNTLIVEDGTATYRETGVTACLTQFGQLVSGSATGTAIIEGNDLSFVGTLYCDLETGQAIHPALENVQWVFQHDPETDTLTLTRDVKTRLGRATNR